MTAGRVAVITGWVKVATGVLFSGVGLAVLVAFGMVGDRIGVAVPGMGISFNGVMLGEGVRLGTRVRTAVWLGNSTFVGVICSPHNPAVLPRQDVNNEVMMAI